MRWRGWRAGLFWIVSRTATCAYRAFPFRGYLPGAIAIIRRGRQFVVIDRSDGFGLAFPGGVGRRGEDPARTVLREVREETGLEIFSARLLFSFKDDSFYPAHTFVFAAEAGGQMRGSWEGAVTLASLDELRTRIIRSQQSVVQWLEREQMESPQVKDPGGG